VGILLTSLRVRRLLAGLAVACAAVVGGTVAPPPPASAEAASVTGVRVVYVAPDADGVIDLTAIAATADTVYALVPSPYGPIELVVEAADSYGASCSPYSAQDPRMVWGGANPPRRYGYHYNAYVQGDARLMSCTSQTMYISLEHPGGPWNVSAVTVPGRRWVTIPTMQIGCDRDWTDGGRPYRTHVETQARAPGGGPAWASTSSPRSWPDC
jgi:hypothetical protein